MSQKGVFDQPGVEKVLPGQTAELPIAVKVTGRNMHAVSLIASTVAESTEKATALCPYFNKDGSLASVELFHPQIPDGYVEIKPGEYLILAEDKTTIAIASKQEFDFVKKGMELSRRIDETIAKIAGDVLNAIGVGAKR
ncbi:hypothetical protein SEA_APPLETREE2_49 [Mycobacterium phage Appletree2]|nr:hypothetical protein SEA_APPLETREE2_49 [Mycobacterium phage Appletree2]